MDLSNLVQIVRDSRSMTAMVFPLPDVDGCVDYAITEAGETLDAMLREKRTGDKRNNSKQSDVRKEWGQCGYMIASAIIQCNDLLDSMEAPEFGNDIYGAIVQLCQYRVTEDKSWIVDAMVSWVDTCESNGWDAAELMVETCNAFERKHLPELFEVAA